MAIITENITDRLDAEKSNLSMEYDVKNDVCDKSESEDVHQLQKMKHSPTFRYALLDCLFKIMESDPGSTWLVAVTSLNVGLREGSVLGVGRGSGCIVSKSKEQKEEVEKRAVQERLSFERLVKVTLSSSLLPSLLFLLSRTALS